MHAYIHTYIHTGRQSYIHTGIHTHIHRYRLAYIHTYINACIHTHIHAYILTGTYREYTQTYIHTYIDTYIQRGIQYIHTCMQRTIHMLLYLDKGVGRFRQLGTLHFGHFAPRLILRHSPSRFCILPLYFCMPICIYAFAFCIRNSILMHLHVDFAFCIPIWILAFPFCNVICMYYYHSHLLIPFCICIFMMPLHSNLHLHFCLCMLHLHAHVDVYCLGGPGEAFP